MQNLIERLEKATGPDSKLDREIATACGIAWSPDEEGQFGGYDIMPRRVRFTASLDAARILADGFYWIASEGKTRDAEPLGGAQVFRKNYLVKPLAEAEHESVEIALCIAALKARGGIIADQRGEK